MEELRSSRRPAKSSYGDVFGVTPKYSAPVSAKTDDYAEIFGGIARSCSIPFLDLPPLSGSCDGSRLIDYSEIFGDFGGGNFAVDYEELITEKKKMVESSASSNGRAQIDAKFGQHAEVSDISPEGASKNYGTCSEEKNKFSSSSKHSDDLSKPFSMLYHRTSHDSIEDVISGKTHINQLHAVPGYASMINSCSSLDVRSNDSLDIQTNDLTNNISYNGQLNDLEREKMAPATSSTDNTKSYGADLKTNLKEYSTKHAASEDDPVNMKHQSCSSSNYLASNGETPYHDATYVSISDINIRTRPSRVPPPSRAPPMLVSKQENTKHHLIHYSVGASKSNGLQGIAKVSSSGFLDVDVDASLAAAASAAAMKEAMEQAQARLRSAKELMERKRENLHSRKKLGHKDGEYDEKEVKTSEIEKKFIEVTPKKPLLKEDKGVKEYALDDMQKVIKVGKDTPDHGEKEREDVTGEENCQMRQSNGSKSSQMHYKSEEISGEWNTDEQFYELINNENKFRAVKESPKQEDVEKKPETATEVNDDKEEYSEKTVLANRFGTTAKLQKIDETIERYELGDNSKACNMTSKEEIRKIPEGIPETCMLNENKPEDSSENAMKKLQAPQEALISGEELKKPDASKEASCGENQMNLQSSKDAFRFDDIYHDNEENRKSQITKDACEHDVKEKELSGTYLTSAPHESEEKLKMFRRTDVQDENENEMEVNSGTCVREAEEELVAHERAYLCESSDYVRENGEHESCNEESKCKLEGSSSVSEHVETRQFSGPQGPCLPVEDGLQGQVAQGGNDFKENSEEYKSALGSIGLRMTQKKMNSAKEISRPDYGGEETREAQLELLQNEKQNADQMHPVVLNTVEPGVSGGTHAESENRKFKEGNWVLGSEKSHNQFDAAQEDFQRAADKDIGAAQQGSRAENEGLGDAAEVVCLKLRSSSHGPTETLGTEYCKSVVNKREKLESEKIIERETYHAKEQARKVEEEKEREREREKDRLGVERATREAHERALAETRERAERIAVERVTAEARRRALAEAWEKAERASAESLERSLAEKALKEAKLRAERAAVERATAEARERAVEKALAEKAAADARQRAERLNTISRDKNQNNEGGDYFRASDKEDKEMKLNPNSSDVLHDVRFQNAGLSGSSQRYADSSAHGEVDSPLRCKARLERHQRTVERAAKALAEKNMRDILAQREQAERNRLAESLDADVKRWSTGKEGNLRALLSTLQYILGPESGWQSIPLTDVITAAAVKKAYRKATLCVHPDKLQQRGASIQQKYICEKVFDLLKAAWNRFNSEER